MATSLALRAPWYDPRGWWSALTRGWAQPTTTPTEFVAGSDFVPDAPAMPGFDPRTAMSAYGSMSWVVACAEIVAADLSRLPIRVTANGKGRGAKSVDHPILGLLRRPYRGTSGAWLRRQWSIDYDLTGTAYGLVLVGGARRQVPVGLMRMHPARTEVAPGDDGVPSRFVYTGNGREVHYNADAVLYFRGASWEDDPRMLYGQGKIRALAKDLATDDALAANTTISAGKGRPDGIVYPDSDTEQWTAAQVKGFREDLDRLLREANGGLAVLGRKLGYQALGWSESELATIDQRKFLRQSVQAVFGVPPVRLGITDSVNYATADQQMQLYWGDTLRARASVFDEVLTELAVRAWPEFGEVEVWHDFADVPALQAMEEARLKRVAMHIANGMEANAAYAYEGLTDAPKVEPPAAPVTPPPAKEPPPADAPPPEAAKASVPVEALFRAPEPAPVDVLGELGMGPEEPPEWDRVAAWEGYRRRVHAPAEARILEGASAWMTDLRKVMQERFDAYLKQNPQARGMTAPSPEIRRDLAEMLMAALFLLARDTNIGWSLMEPIVQELIRAAFGRQALAWGFPSLAYDLTRERRATDEQLGSMIQGVYNTLQRDVRVNILAGLDRGASVSEIAADILSTNSAIFDMARAQRIARTETTRSIEAGNMMAFEALANAGAEFQEEWLSSRDTAVRPDHVLLDGEKIEVGGRFTVPAPSKYAGATAPHPSAFGIPELDIDCRCTAVGRRLKGQSQGDPTPWKVNPG